MNINPYMFLLLKRLIEIEIELATKERPTIFKVVTKVEQVFGKSKYSEHNAEAIRKAWSKKEFILNEQYLDVMAQLPKVIIQNNSWKDFLSKEGGSHFYEIGESLNSKSFDKLDIQERMYVKSMANIRASEIYMDKIAPKQTDTRISIKSFENKNVSKGNYNSNINTEMRNGESREGNEYDKGSRDNYSQSNNQNESDSYAPEIHNHLRFKAAAIKKLISFQRAFLDWDI